MKTLISKINSLLEFSTDDRLRSTANQVLEYSKLTNRESELRLFLVANTKNFFDSLNEQEKNFLIREEKYLILEDLNLTNFFKDIMENLNGDLNAIKIPLLHLAQQHELHSTNALGVMEKLYPLIAPYAFLPIIDKHIKIFDKIYEDNKEELMIHKFASQINSNGKNVMYSKISDLLYEYLDGNISRTTVLNELSSYSKINMFGNFLKELSKFENSETIHIINENRNFDVSKIFSFIHMDENKNLYFANNNMIFEKGSNSLNLVKREDMNKIPEMFMQLNSLIMDPNILITNESVVIKMKNNHKISFIYESDETIKVFYDDKEITTKNILPILLKENTLENSSTVSFMSVQALWENIHLLAEIDFGKNIYSKAISNVGATVYKINEDFYVHKFNPINGINELSLNTALQARNSLLEYMKYDISESFSEYMGKDISKIQSWKREQNEIKEDILKLNQNINKIEEELKLEESVQLRDVISLINEEINNLKNEYRLLEEEIDKVETSTKIDKNKKSALAFSANQTVQIKKTKEIGKVIFVNTAMNGIEVMLDNGKTLMCAPEDLIEYKIKETTDSSNVKPKNSNYVPNVMSEAESDFFDISYKDPIDTPENVETEEPEGNEEELDGEPDGDEEEIEGDEETHVNCTCTCDDEEEVEPEEEEEPDDEEPEEESDEDEPKEENIDDEEEEEEKPLESLKEKVSSKEELKISAQEEINKMTKIWIDNPTDRNYEKMERIYNKYQKLFKPELDDLGKEDEEREKELVGMDEAIQTSDKFGVFVYDKENDGEEPTMNYFATQVEAVNFAKKLKLEKNEYVEVWQKDNKGLFGNSGSPIYKSDSKTNESAINEAMSRQTYVAVAASLAKQKNEIEPKIFDMLVSNFKEIFAKDNPNFDAARFEAACKK